MTDYVVEDDVLRFHHALSNGDEALFHLPVDPNLTPEEQINSFINEQEQIITQIEEWLSQ